MTNRQMIRLHVEPCEDELFIGDNMIYLSRNKKQVKHSIVKDVLHSTHVMTVYVTIEGINVEASRVCKYTRSYKRRKL